MMRHVTPIATLAVLGLIVSANAASGDLESRVTASDGWVAYRVPMSASVDPPCCYSVHDGSATTKGCDLDGHSWGFASDHNDPAAALDGTLSMYFRVEHGRVERVRAVAASCPVHTENTVRWLESVDPANSVAMLSSLLDRKTADTGDATLVALAYHPGGADVIEHYATTNPDPKLRAKAIFPLTLSKGPDAYAHILTIAHDDPAEEVRGEAFFWLAQMNYASAKDDIIASLKTEGSDRVREQAVFALSQLHNGAADDALIAVLRGDYPRAVKKSAMFWLGQSGTPQAMAYFDETLK
jgi:hypothetical protein